MQAERIFSISLSRFSVRLPFFFTVRDILSCLCVV
jgi:hypothetical protein